MPNKITFHRVFLQHFSGEKAVVPRFHMNRDNFGVRQAVMYFADILNTHSNWPPGGKGRFSGVAYYYVRFVFFQYFLCLTIEYTIAGKINGELLRAAYHEARHRGHYNGSNSVAVSGRSSGNAYAIPLKVSSDRHQVGKANINKYATREQARRDIFWYIETFYNCRRRHQALNYLTPCAYKQRYYDNCAA